MHTMLMPRTPDGDLAVEVGDLNAPVRMQVRRKRITRTKALWVVWAVRADGTVCESYPRPALDTYADALAEAVRELNTLPAAYRYSATPVYAPCVPLIPVD